MPRTDVATDSSHIKIRVIQDGDQFHASIENVFVASSSTVIGLIPPLIQVLDDAVVEHLTTLRAVHAGTVLWNERALLLPGATHAGKSSLVAELLRRGATYFSDEFALIDPEGFVHPYPRPLLLRNGRPAQSPVLPGEFNAPVGDAPARVGWILALEYQPDYNWSVDLVPQSEAVITLLKNTPHFLKESPDMVSTFQRAVEGAACYAGRRADAVPAVDQILRLIANLAG
ncbi:MAG: hypothetical protein WAM85_14670 [Terracidiphilus sp.]